MQEILLKVPQFVQLASLGLMVLVLVATLIARLTPSKKDDEVVEAAGNTLVKIIHWLPTIGVNPRTAALEAAYADLKAQTAPAPATESASEPKAA